MGESINLREYVDMFKRRKVVVILIMLLCLGLGGYKTYKNYMSYEPTYSSTLTIRINTAKNVKKDKKNENNQFEDPYSTYNISQNQNIASTYYTLASSPNVHSTIASSLKISSADVGSISPTVREDLTEFIDINVVNKDKTIAKKVAEKVPEAFSQEIIRLTGIDCVQVIYKPTAPALIERTTDLTLAKFAAVGLVLSIFLVLLIECLDTKIVTPDDVVKYWDYQLIGTIPLDSKSSKGKGKKKEQGGEIC